MNKVIRTFNDSHSIEIKEICYLLHNEINRYLPEAEVKIWYAHPVWFLDGNPIVGYNSIRDGIRLNFWSGASFEEEKLMPGKGKIKNASIRFTDVDQINCDDLKRWLLKAKNIQWDYTSRKKRNGSLKRVK